MVTAAPARFLPRERFGELFGALKAGGRRIVGPAEADGSIVLDELAGPEALPAGVGLRTSAGRSRLVRRLDARLFDHPVGPTSLKRFTFPSRVDALAFERDADGVARVRVTAPEPQPTAFIGVRACDLAALAIQDHVLAGGAAVDPDYAARRRDLMIVAVECAVAGGTCFCASMGTGPEVGAGADVVLSELDDGFVVRTGSAVGEALVAGLGLGPANDEAVHAAAAQVAATRASMTHGVAAEGLADRLLGALDHPRWETVAERCVACGNCTLACPTCFCTGLTITSDLDGGKAGATRTWDSCFTEGFAQVAGGSFRARHRDRYRQWLTHKFGTWWQQFGSSGCVGCGRCIAWCPVGIDVRDELVAIAGTPVAPAAPVAHPAPVKTAAPASPAVVHLPGPGTIPLEFSGATILDVRPETADTVTLRVATEDPRIAAGRPGQFVMVGQPALAIPPISISRFHTDGVELTIRAAGPATAALTRMRRGQSLVLRGPLGRGWPVDDARGRDVVVVAGGIGLAPIRPVLDAVLAEREAFGAVRLYLGARTPRDRLYIAEIAALADREDVMVRETVDRAGADWFGRVGIVTQLFGTVQGSGEDVTAFVCGPERMMQATAEVLEDLGVPREHLWLTLERRMECGVGLCGHCQTGGRFVCRHGPVFSVAELGDALLREGW